MKNTLLLIVGSAFLLCAPAFADDNGPLSRSSSQAFRSGEGVAVGAYDLNKPSADSGAEVDAKSHIRGGTGARTGGSMSNAAGGAVSGVNDHSEQRSGGGVRWTERSALSSGEKGNLKGNVTFSETGAADRKDAHSVGGKKDGIVKSGSTIPPGWVVVGENSNGEVRYGPPDTASSTSQEQVVPGEISKTGLLEPKIKMLPTTTLDPFVIEKPELLYGDEGVSDAPLPLQFREALGSPPWESSK